MPQRDPFDDVLALAVVAVTDAGRMLKSRFTTTTRPDTARALKRSLAANDMAVLPPLRQALSAARPGADWVENEEEGGMLPAGDWWVVDPVEGNVNHVHGRPAWGVTATLLQDSVAVLTVAHLPMVNETYTAIAGRGAFANGVPLRVSAKRDLGAAMIGTGQARPTEASVTHRRIGLSVAAMLDKALLVRMSVPTTLELLDVASGRSDGFWQFSQVRAGLVGGALLVTEAGGRVTDMQGRPWNLASADFLATAPDIHSAAAAVLAEVDRN